jgi:hypothetical protein
MNGGRGLRTLDKQKRGFVSRSAERTQASAERSVANPSLSAGVEDTHAPPLYRLQLGGSSEQNQRMKNASLVDQTKEVTSRLPTS